MWIITKEGTAKNIWAPDYRERLENGTVRLPTHKELQRLPSSLTPEYRDEIPEFCHPVKEKVKAWVKEK